MLNVLPENYFRAISESLIQAHWDCAPYPFLQNQNYAVSLNLVMESKKSIINLKKALKMSKIAFHNC